MTSSNPRRQALRLSLVALALSAGLAPAWADADAGRADRAPGRLYTSSNGVAGNELLVYARPAAGAPTLIDRVSTQGSGTGAGLGSQGAVTLSRDGRWLFVVNAGSNSVSTFTIEDGAASLRSTVDSGGLTPISVTEHGGRVYVLNAGGNGQVNGFRNRHGVLEPLADATGTLSAATGTGPAQVGLSEDGDVLVVTEKNTNRLTSFVVQGSGRLLQKAVTASAGAVPFGFAFSKHDTLIVSEAAASSVSSYRFADRSAQPELLTAALPNTQGAACWIAVTPDGRYAYSANAATSSVSSFGVARDGRLTLLQGQAALTGTGAGALDMAVPHDGTQLHVVAPAAHRIVSYRIGDTGALETIGAVDGLPVGSAGLAAD